MTCNCLCVRNNNTKRKQRGQIITSVRFNLGLEKSIAPEIMGKIRGTEKMHKLRYIFAVQLRNTETEKIAYYQSLL